WDPIAAMGGRRLRPGEAVQALEEGIAVIRALWNVGERGRIEGQHYRVVGAKPGRAPAHPVKIWIGGSKPRMLNVIGRVGDGWLPSSPYAGPETLAERNAIIDEAAQAAGRDPAAIRRLYNIGGTFDRAGSGFLNGPPAVWV